MNEKVHTLKSGGRLHYVEKGAGDVALFVHGIWANHVLWERVVTSLPDTVRAIAPDWPLGSQPEAFPAGTDLSPGGMVAMIAELIEALDLRDVTLVGNDSGGGLCQLFITSDHPAAKRVDQLLEVAGGPARDDPPANRGTHREQPVVLEEAHEARRGHLEELRRICRPNRRAHRDDVVFDELLGILAAAEILPETRFLVPSREQ